MKDKYNLNDWTKTELAQVIMQALLNTKDAPAAEDPRVKKLVRVNGKATLVNNAQQAIEVLWRNYAKEA